MPVTRTSAVSAGRRVHTGPAPTHDFRGSTGQGRRGARRVPSVSGDELVVSPRLFVLARCPGTTCALDRVTLHPNRPRQPTSLGINGA